MANGIIPSYLAEKDNQVIVSRGLSDTTICDKETDVVEVSYVPDSLESGRIAKITHQIYVGDKTRRITEIYEFSSVSYKTIPLDKQFYLPNEALNKTIPSNSAFSPPSTLVVPSPKPLDSLGVSTKGNESGEYFRQLMLIAGGALAAGGALYGICYYIKSKHHFSEHS